VQQQALRDFAQAMACFFAGTHGRPSWRKAGKDEGFRITSLAVSGAPLLNFRPGRSVTFQDSLFVACVQEDASRGLSCPFGVALTSWAEARPTANIVSYWWWSAGRCRWSG
jgi:hypothetical protein